jgi:hypothetical protein
MILLQGPFLHAVMHHATPELLRQAGVALHKFGHRYFHVIFVVGLISCWVIAVHMMVLECEAVHSCGERCPACSAKFEVPVRRSARL